MTNRLPERPKLTIAPKHLAILFLPMVVVALSEMLLSAFADTNVLLAVQLLEQAELAELTARYRFLAVFFFFLAITVAIIGIFAAELFSRHSRVSILRTAIGLGLLVLFAQLYTNWDPEWMGSFKAYELLGAELFRAGLRAAEMPLCTAGRCGEDGAYHAYRLLMTIANNLSAFAVSAVILGMMLALARPGPIVLTTKDGILAEAATLVEAQKAVRRYLYLAGVLLSVSMMFGLGWMMWPAGLLADNAEAQDYAQLVQSVSLYRGVSYSVLIMSFYMPVSLIQMVRIERLHDAALGAGMEDVSAEVKGFDIERIGSLDAFKAILSVLSPIIAGAVGSFTGINVLG